MASKTIKAAEIFYAGRPRRRMKVSGTKQLISGLIIADALCAQHPTVIPRPAACLIGGQEMQEMQGRQGRQGGAGGAQSCTA